MEKIWINEFICTKDIIAEYQNKWWGRRRKAAYIVIVVMTVVILVASYFEKSIAPELLASPLLFLLVKAGSRTIVRKECERVEMLYGSKAPQVHVEVGGDVCLKIEGKERRLSLSDIRKVLESKNLILIYFKGDLIVHLHKQGFIKGDAKTCIAYLKSKMKSRQ